MYFTTLAELIAMNGHGAYVWSAYGIGFAVVAALVWLPLQRHRKLQLALRRSNVLPANNCDRGR